MENTAINSSASPSGTNSVAVYLGLGLSGGKILLDIENIKAITPVGKCQSIPLVKPWRRGITNWHGKFLTVIDVSELLGGIAQRSTNQTQMLVVEHQRFFYGLLFQSIEEKFHVNGDLWQKHAHTSCVGALRGCVDAHVIINEQPWHGFELSELFEHPKLFNILAST